MEKDKHLESIEKLKTAYSKVSSEVSSLLDLEHEIVQDKTNPYVKMLEIQTSVSYNTLLDMVLSMARGIAILDIMKAAPDNIFKKSENEQKEYMKTKLDELEEPEMGIKPTEKKILKDVKPK